MVSGSQSYSQKCVRAWYSETVNSLDIVLLEIKPNEVAKTGSPGARPWNSSSNNLQCVYRILASIGEVKLRLLTLEWHSWPFWHHFQVNGLTRLYTDHQLIPVHVRAAKDVTTDVTKLDAHFGFAFIQCWSHQHKTLQLLPTDRQRNQNLKLISESRINHLLHCSSSTVLTATGFQSIILPCLSWKRGH